MISSIFVTGQFQPTRNRRSCSIYIHIQSCRSVYTVVICASPCGNLLQSDNVWKITSSKLEHLWSGEIIVVISDTICVPLSLFQCRAFTFDRTMILIITYGIYFFGYFFFLYTSFIRSLTLDKYVSFYQVLCEFKWGST